MEEHRVQQDHVSRLIEQLRSTYPEKRQEAARELGGQRSPRAIDPLVAAIRDEEGEVARYAAFALGVIGDDGARRLLDLLHDPAAHIRGWAAAGLAEAMRAGTLNAGVLKPLQDASTDSDSEVRRAVASVLRLRGYWTEEPTALGPALFVTTVWADHHQFMLTDIAFDDLPDHDDEAYRRGISVGPRWLVHVHTKAYGTVPVRVELRATMPDDDPTRWDHVAEVSFDVVSGGIAFWELFDELPEEPQMRLHPGTYRLRLYCGNLSRGHYSVDDDDFYRIILWPAPWQDPQVIHTTPYKQ